MNPTILHGNCITLLERSALVPLAESTDIDLTFLDPPFNQDKEYAEHDDNLPEEEYWKWMQEVCSKIFRLTSTGGAIYFMQREKNTEFVLRCLRKSGWTFQNLIIWKKKTSAVPGTTRFGKHYQIIAFATKGERPRVFHRLRINPPLPAGYKYEREDGMFVTDVWDDIRELTSGYFAGDEALRDAKGSRLHKQQSPIQLLLRIILSSTNPGDTVLDPFAGTGTTLIVAEQLHRKAIGIELDKANVQLIQRRITEQRESDNASKFFKEYEHTPELKTIWGMNEDSIGETKRHENLPLFQMNLP
jgi:DNA modification methylase